MKKRTSIVILFLLILFHCETVLGQRSDSQKIHRIEMVDGSVLIGEILSEDDQYITVKTEKAGTIRIVKSDISNKKIVQQAQFKDGQLWPENIHSTRYFFSPNAYNLRKGESYYQNIGVIVHQVSYGFNDNFSIGAGVIPLFIFGGIASPVWITPKFSFPIVENKLNFGFGALLGTVIGAEFRSPGFGILYGTSTFGSRDKNFSFGAGWAFVEGEIARYPTFNLSGIIRLGPRGYLMTENYFIGTRDDFFSLMSIGGRRMFSEVGLDFGLFIPVSNLSDFWVAIPWLGIAIPLSHGKTKP
jgi:hypothetical protein